MTDLYTSLSRAKQILLGTRNVRGGAVLAPPAMMPLPEESTPFIDPDFTIGYGALRECGSAEGFPCPECGPVCENRGLQCPVRGCGEYFRNLSHHVALVHPSIGVKGLKRLLGIPLSAPLTTEDVQEAAQGRTDFKIRRGRGEYGQIARIRRDPEVMEKARQSRKATTRTPGWRNLLNTCDAQIAQRMHALVDRIGRSPTVKEADLMDPGLQLAAVKLYGSWNNAKLQLGLDVNPRGRPPVIEREKVLSALREWYMMWGELPSWRDAGSPERVPIIHEGRTTLRAMEAESWQDAMIRAADALGIPRSAYSHRTRADGGKWRREISTSAARSGLTAQEVREEMLASLARQRELAA